MKTKTIFQAETTDSPQSFFLVFGLVLAVYEKKTKKQTNKQKGRATNMVLFI